ncbi:TPA: hypothetical protein EYO57_24335 [Candidatus Poribacteria bacterium]|nr:hypothetical protein [Candidatus Poribacteria bacterium]
MNFDMSLIYVSKTGRFFLEWTNNAFLLPCKVPTVILAQRSTVCREVYCQIQDCCKNGKLDRAHELQQYANQVTNVIIAVGFPEALKEVMKMLGFDCGNPRLPSYPISNENQKILHKKLEGSGFSELVEI